MEPIEADPATLAATRGAASPGVIDASLAAEVRATFLLFGMVLLVTMGFALVSTLALRFLAS